MAGKSPASHHSISSGKTAPTLIPIGKFAGKPEVSLSRTVTLIGSGAQSRLQLISSTVSKSHALVVNCARGCYVRDLASRTKVLVNGQEQREAVLNSGDSVQFGKFAFTYTEAPGRSPLDEDEEDRRIPEPPAPGAFEVTGVDTPIPLNERCLLIGRRETCDIVISDDAVSTAHAVIFEMDGRRFVRDLGSRTGTFVNGKQVHQADVSLGDTIRIGSIDLKYVPVEVAVEESASDVDDLDHLVRTDNLGTDAMAAAAADDIAEAQARAAARSMKQTGEPEPVPIQRPEDSMDVIPIEEIGLEDTAAAGAEELARAADAPLPDDVAALEELTVDDLMDGSQSLDDIAPVTDEMQVTHEPEPVRAPQPARGQQAEPVSEAPPAEVGQGRGGVKPFDGNLSMLDLPEPEIPHPAPNPLGEAGPLEMAPPVNLNAPPRTPFREKPIVEGEAPLVREDEDVLLRGRAPKSRQPREEVAPAAEAPMPAPEIAPKPAAAEHFDLDEVLGLVPASPAPANAPIPVDEGVDEVEVASADVDELPPLAVEPLQEETPAAEPIAVEPREVEPVAEPVAEEDIELETIPLEPMPREPEPVAEQQAEPRDELDVIPVDAEAAAEAPAEDIAAQTEEEPVAEIEQEHRAEELAETPAATAEPEPLAVEADRPIPISISDEDDEDWSDQAQAVDEVAIAPAPVPPSVAASAPPPLVAPVFEREEQEEYAEEDQLATEAAAEPAAELRFAIPPAPVEEPAAPHVEEELAIEQPAEIEAPALDLSPPIEEAPLARAEPVEAMPFDLDLSATAEDTLPGLEDDGLSGMSLDLPAEETAPAADLGLTIPQAPAEDVTAPAPTPKKRGRRARKAKVAPPPTTADEISPAPTAVPEPISETPAPESVAELPLVDGPLAEAPPEVRVADAPSVPMDDVLSGPSAPAVPEEVIAALAPSEPEAAAPPAEDVEPPVEVEAAEPIGLAEESSPADFADSADRGTVEVIEESATPSVMEIGEELGSADLTAEPEAASAMEEAAALTDTRFGRAVEEFTSESTTGPLIEEPASAQIDIEPIEVAEPQIDRAAEREKEPAEAVHEPVAERPAVEPLTPVGHRSLDEESIAEMLGEGPTGDAPLAVNDPMAGFASFNTLARELDLDEPVLEGLPALEPGAEAKFQAHAHEEPEPQPEPVAEAPGQATEAPDLVAEAPEPAAEFPETSLEDVLNEALGGTAEVTVPPRSGFVRHEPAIDEIPKASAAEIPGPTPAREAPAEELSPALSDLDALTELEAEIEAEPVAYEPAAPEPVAEAPQPVAEAPKPAQPSPPPQSPRRAPADMNWGANQEHFLGGMPLSLGDLKPRQAPLVSPGAGQPQPPPPAFGAPAGPAQPIPPAQGAPGDGAPQHPQRPSPQPPQRGPRLVPMVPPQRRPAQRPKVPAGMGLIAPSQSARQNKQVSTGFDGLALGGPRQVDVFSQMPVPVSRSVGDAFGGGGAGAGAPPMDDVFGGRNPRAPRQQTGGDEHRAPQHRAAPEPGETPWDQNQSQPSQANDSGEGITTPPTPQQSEPPRKKRRWFGLKSLLLLMILSMAATAAGIWYLMPQQARVVGTLKFTDSYKKLTELEKVRLERDQRELLFDEQVRKEARAILATQKRDAKAGFLESPVEFAKVVQAAKFDLTQGVFSVSYLGTDAANDPSRMQALLRALYNGNKGSVRDVEKLRTEVADLERARTAKQKEVEGYDQQMAKYRLAAESRPDAAEQTRLESEATRLDGEYRDAMQAVAKVSADIQKLKAQPPATAPSASPARAGGVTATSAPIADTELAQYENDLRKATQRLTWLKEVRTQKATDTRKWLDAAADAFAKQLEQAQTAAKANADLAKYVTSAGQVANSLRDLSEQYLKRQQEQDAKLKDARAALEDKLAARRADAMKNDPKLKEYLDQKDIKTRQYNAAVASSYTTEAGDLKADLDLLERMIKARETQYGDDAFYADAIARAQKQVESTQSAIETDRRETAGVMEQTQLALAKQKPATDSLTADQKKLIADLENRLTSLADARKGYNDAARLAAAQADDEIRQIEASAASLTEKINARKRQTAAQRDGNLGALDSRERQETLQARQEQLAKAQAAQAAASASLQSAQAKLTDLHTRLEAARNSGDKLDELTRVSDHARKELEQLTSQWELKRRLSESRAEPLPPTPGDVTVESMESERKVYVLAAVGGVAAFFSALMLISVVGGSGGGRSMTLPPMAVQEYAGEPFYAPQQERYAQAPSSTGAASDEYDAMPVDEADPMTDTSLDGNGDVEHSEYAAQDAFPDEDGAPARA